MEAVDQHIGSTYDLAILKKKATEVRAKVIENLDQYLVEFETAFLKGKGKLHWAVDAMEANKLLSQIIAESGGSYFLGKAAVFNELSSANYLRARRELTRVEDRQAANSVVGGVHFCTSENPTALISNAVLHNADLEGVEVVLVISIDQLMPAVSDLYAISPLFSTRVFGDAIQLLPLLKSSKLHVVLVDNGRSQLLSLQPQLKLLQLAHPYQFVINNDDESNDFERLYYAHIGEGNASSIIDDFCLDGYADDEVYLDINLEEIVIADRALKSEKAKSDGDIIWRTWKGAMLNRKILNRSSFGPISLMKSFYKRGFEGGRSFPKVAKSSFSEQWVKERPNVVESRKLTDIPKGQLLVRKPATDGIND